MCGSTEAPNNQAAELQRIIDKERSDRIASSIDAIGKNFGGFDDNYYKSAADAYTGYYLPQWQQQYDRAKIALPATFGSTDGSEYQKQLALFEQQALQDKAQIENGGQDFANQQRQTVENERQALISQANSVANPDATASLAAAQAQALAAPKAFSPIGDLFAKFTAVGANATAAQNAGYSGGSLGGAVGQPLLFSGGAKGGGGASTVVK